MSSNKTNSVSRMQPWLLTIVIKDSLQRFRVLAFGRSSESAFSHFLALPHSDGWYLDESFMLSNDHFVCVASLSNLFDLAPWLQ